MRGIVNRVFIPDDLYFDVGEERLSGHLCVTVLLYAIVLPIVLVCGDQLRTATNPKCSLLSICSTVLYNSTYLLEVSITGAIIHSTEIATGPQVSLVDQLSIISIIHHQHHPSSASSVISQFRTNELLTYRKVKKAEPCTELN